MRSPARSGRLLASAALATTLIALTAVASCTSDASTLSATTTAAARASSNPPTSPSPNPSAGPQIDPGPSSITLSFAGDVHFATKLAPLLEHPRKALSSLQPTLGRADFSMVNLETAVTTRGTAQPKEFHFRASPAAFEAVQSGGIDAVTMANNHAADYGPVGVQDSLAAIAQSPIPVVGFGADAAAAYAPTYVDVRGTRVALLAAMQIPDWTAAHFAAGKHTAGVATVFEPGRLGAAVRTAKRNADVVVVYLHWGTEYTSCPNALQRSTAKALAAAGASVIVGAHAHKLQGAGWLGNTYVDYGLGNFVWWRRQTVVESYSGVLTLSLTGHRVTAARWRPMLVSASGIPQVVSGAQQVQLAAYWKGLRSCTGLSARPRG